VWPLTSFGPGRHKRRPARAANDDKKAFKIGHSEGQEEF